MRRCSWLSLVVVLAAPSVGSAQTPPSRAFDLQVDPTPFFLRGFAPELGVTGAIQIGHRFAF